MNRFPGVGRRIRERLKATDYWKDGRPEIARFCSDKGYRPQYLYAWLGDRVPSYENLGRLAQDLDVPPEWIMFGTGATSRAPVDEPGDGARSARRAQVIDFVRLRDVTGKLVRLEAELQAIVRAFPDLYFWLDAEGRFLACEGGRGSEFEVPRELVLGKRIADAFPPEVSPQLEQAARDCADSGTLVAAEFALGARSYEARFLPLEGPQPGQAQLLVIVREITERKQAEDAAAALSRVSHELVGTLEFAEASERVVSAVVELFRVRRAALMRLDPESGALVCVAVAGDGDHDKWKGQVWPAGAGIGGLAIREGRPVWSRDITTEPRTQSSPPWLRERIAAEGHRSVVSVPLTSRGEVLGVLTLASTSERVFTGAELGLLSGFADAAALALQNARLYDDARRRRREAEVVAALAARIGASLELGAVLQAVVEGALELCLGDLAAIALREPGGEALVMRHWAGFRSPSIAALRIEPGKGIGGVVLSTGRPFRTDDYAADARFGKDYLPGVRADEIVTAVVVPIKIEQRVEGLLYVHNRSPRPFDDRDEAVLTRLAEHAALAIGNARVYERSERRRLAAETLADVGRLICQSLDPEVVAQGIADSVLMLFGARASTILRLRPESGDLQAIATAGDLSPGVGWGLVLQSGMGAAGLAVRQRLPVVTPDLLDESGITLPPELRSALAGSSDRAALAVPLLVRDEATGALVVRDRTGHLFGEEEVRLLQAFAAQAALAMENAERFRGAGRGAAT